MALEWMDKPTEPGWYLEAHAEDTIGLRGASTVHLPIGGSITAMTGWKYLGPLPEFPKPQTTGE